MINKIIYNYSSNETKITTSLLPNTTVDLIKVKINDSLTLIDTPGILDDGNIINYLDKKEIKKLYQKT
jgi:ribosome biogenesis GTPase A